MLHDLDRSLRTSQIELSSSKVNGRTSKEFELAITGETECSVAAFQIQLRQMLSRVSTEHSHRCGHRRGLFV